MQALPIDAHLPRITSALREHSSYPHKTEAPFLALVEEDPETRWDPDLEGFTRA